MKIKYHQYGLGEDYDKNHMLTDNWNPDVDYGNRYARVHVNINTPTYHFENGFSSTEDSQTWHKEISDLIASFGILEDSGYKVEHSDKKCAYLYAHPQQISGVILKNDVKKVAEAISEMKLSSIRWVDLYETVYHISDEEYEEYLKGKEDIIRKILFEIAYTRKSSIFYHLDDVARNTANRVRLPRLGIRDGKIYGSGQTMEYIKEVAKKMEEEGYLVFHKKGDIQLVRSINKTEQKQKKLSCAFA